MKLQFFILSLVCIWNSVFAQMDSISVEKNSVTFHNWQANSIDASIFVFDKTDRIPIHGNFYKAENDLVFIPQFPLLQTRNYVFVFEQFKKDFSLPRENSELPKVTAIFPSANKLPENLLRMYIQFSQPMKTIGNLENIKLIDENGKEVKGAIFNNVHELWDASQTQLTIIFDPARVKTGLIANETLGRALTPNKTFTLVIDNLEDIYGEKLEKPYMKAFSVFSADTIAPDTTIWKIEIPVIESMKPLKLHFFDTVDKMSLQTRIQIFNAENKLIRGKMQIENQEKTWSFIPEKTWKKGTYFITVNSRLADPSGNNLNGLFDHEIGSLKNDREGEIVRLKFLIK
ncbi:hypothetical protein [uncultured Kordia sp.]|uniref:hypothetical protein n=1 Tax=uncultured Kordia sp. TaxID=507699 RepID=UPI002631D5D4|nr:hypothetical protein [uncultured Kordia sp.]